MIRLRSVARLSLLGALVATSAFSTPRTAAVSPTVGSIAAQLGVKVAIGDYDDFDVGIQFTGSLVDPGKLSAFGLRDMKAGARVYVARIGLDRVQVEADQIDPARRESARIPLGADGRLTAPPRV